MHATSRNPFTLKSMLINLSNHPYSKWDEKQKAAAEKFGETVDLPFPAIDTNGDENYINNLADEYLQKIKKMGEGKELTVHLMGEMTFTFALVKRLQAHGIICVASTSERIVDESVPGHKDVIFRFTKFRKYE